jgi:hypothetical protein
MVQDRPASLIVSHVTSPSPSLRPGLCPPRPLLSRETPGTAGRPQRRPRRRRQRPCSALPSHHPEPERRRRLPPEGSSAGTVACRATSFRLPTGSWSTRRRGAWGWPRTATDARASARPPWSSTAAARPSVAAPRGGERSCPPAIGRPSRGARKGWPTFWPGRARSSSRAWALFSGPARGREDRPAARLGPTRTGRFSAVLDASHGPGLARERPP